MPSVIPKACGVFQRMEEASNPSRLIPRSLDDSGYPSLWITGSRMCADHKGLPSRVGVFHPPTHDSFEEGIVNWACLETQPWDCMARPRPVRAVSLSSWPKSVQGYKGPTGAWCAWWWASVWVPCVGTLLMHFLKKATCRRGLWIKPNVVYFGECSIWAWEEWIYILLLVDDVF